MLVSPADETPSPPCDAQSEEADVALGIERVNGATTLGLRSVVSAWAGLRTFAPDRVPVVGEDPACAGLFWLAGQGGYGIQTAPAMARCLTGLVTGGRLASGPDGARRDGARPVAWTVRSLILLWYSSHGRIGAWEWPSSACRSIRTSADAIRHAAEDEGQTVSAWLAEAARLRVKNLILRQVIDEVMEETGVDRGGARSGRGRGRWPRRSGSGRPKSGDTAEAG